MTISNSLLYSFIEIAQISNVSHVENTNILKNIIMKQSSKWKIKKFYR